VRGRVVKTRTSSCGGRGKDHQESGGIPRDTGGLIDRVKGGGDLGVATIKVEISILIRTCGSGGGKDTKERFT